MNQINLVHVATLLLTLLLFLSVQLSQAKKELLEVNNTYEETLTLANSLTSLKEIYSDKKRVKKSIYRVLKQPSLKFAKIEQRFMKSGIVLSSESLTKVQLNSLMGKILNGTYNISSLKIKKIANDKVSFKMEIKW